LDDVNFCSAKIELSAGRDNNPFGYWHNEAVAAAKFIMPRGKGLAREPSNFSSKHCIEKLFD
jgi:hypothetical protein